MQLNFAIEKAKRLAEDAGAQAYVFWCGQPRGYDAGDDEAADREFDPFPIEFIVSPSGTVHRGHEVISS